MLLLFGTEVFVSLDLQFARHSELLSYFTFDTYFVNLFVNKLAAIQAQISRDLIKTALNKCKKTFECPVTTNLVS